MNINRDYLIINDVKKSNITLDNGSMFFYITDKNTQNIFVNLVINVSNNDLIQKYANIENAEDYTLTMNIIKPNNDCKIIEGKLHDKEKGIFEFNLKKDCCDVVGTYKCELLTKCNINEQEEITTSNSITYIVKKSILNDLDDIVEAPEYPVVIQLLDKLSDIEQYEEDRRANELARQLAEQQRQTRFDALDADMTDSIQAIDNKVIDVENRVSIKEQAVDKLITDTKADIDEYKVAKDQEIDEYKTAKDTEINNAIAAQDNKIDEVINAQNDRITLVENNVVSQNNRLDLVENRNTQQDNRLTAIEAKNVEQDNRLNEIEAIDVAQNTRLDAIEAKNQQQDDRLLDIEKVNKRQDMNLKCLFAESKNNMIDIAEEGNSIYLQNSTTGYTLIDEIKGNTLVNCNKEPNKELILNGNINTSGDNTVTITEGVDSGLVDVALEGNTLVNVSKTKDSTAISKAYAVENSGNHIALQGDIDGSCRPVITGNTLWIDNDTEEVLTAFDEAKNLRLQSSFEDNLVTQEMVDSGEEVADNLGKYRVDYKVTGKNLFDVKAFTQDRYNANFYQKVSNTSFNIMALDSRSWNGDNPNFGYGIKVKRNTKYTISGDVNLDNVRIIFPSIGKNITPSSKTFNTGNDDVIYFKFIESESYPKLISNIQIEKGNIATSYEPYKEYTKTLYLNSPLLEEDTIEDINGKATHVHRYKEVNMPTNLNWRLEGSTINDSLTSFIVGWYSGTKNNGNVIANTMSTIDTTDTSGIRLVNTNMQILIETSKLSTVDSVGLNRYLQQNPLTVVYELNTPQYETISEDSIVCDSYVSGHLDFNTAVPVEKVDFLPFSEELIYLYPSTSYTIQFNSDRTTTADIALGGTQLLAQSIVAGLNRITITTPSELVDNKLIIDGVGANISEVVVTDTDREFKYFEGMKSVGEGGELQIISANSDNTLSNTQQLTHEPLRAVGDAKDRYVLIDGKWYIERNCGAFTLDGSGNILIRYKPEWSNDNTTAFEITSNNYDTNSGLWSEIDKIKCNLLPDILYSSNIRDNTKNIIGITNYIHHIDFKVSSSAARSLDELNQWLSQNNMHILYKLKTPIYEPIDYNPLEVYSDITHISVNSTIPTNVVVKNHGYNCLLKPSTTYTISSNLGLNTVTTPSTLTEDCLRFMDTDTSSVTTMKDVLVLEGDWTTKADLIPANFSGMESAFEQEYDAEKGKYKVNIKVANEDKSKENNITFYINEPLRGVGDAKDRVFIKDDKIVVQRNCGIRAYEDGDFGTYPTDKVNTVYQLAEPTYEEVEYNDTKLFIESFKNSTLFYNSNVPVTSKLYYSYSVPIVDTVSQTANVTDQQDQLIINLATEVAILEMMTL